ncbi:MAG: hypothetical protein R2716_05990 [Microthrixaceae bacterium]
MDSNSTVTPTTRLPHAVVAMLLVVGIVAPIGTRAAAGRVGDRDVHLRGHDPHLRGAWMA